MDVMERQVSRAMAPDATQLVEARQPFGTAAAGGQPAAPGGGAYPALGVVQDVHQ